jgi:hypothetical protein
VIVDANSTPTVTVVCNDNQANLSNSPTGYQVWKNGSAVTGGGSIADTGTAGTITFAVVQLAAGDTDTPGDLTVEVIDTDGGWLGHRDLQVMPGLEKFASDYSGGTLNATIFGSLSGNVTNVTGNVGGKVLGGGAGIITGTGVQAQLPAGAISEATITTPAEAQGRPAGVLGMIRRVFEWGSNKRVRNRTAGIVQLLGANDTTVLETQTQTTTTGLGVMTDTQTKGV